MAHTHPTHNTTAHKRTTSSGTTIVVKGHRKARPTANKAAAPNRTQVNKGSKAKVSKQVAGK